MDGDERAKSDARIDQMKLDIFKLEEVWQQNPENKPGEAMIALCEMLCSHCDFSLNPVEAYDKLASVVLKGKARAQTRVNQHNQATQSTKEDNAN